ncbi:3-oxoacyl-ACP reductase [Paenalcaligenes hominis]|uniref:3-oxoacyl-ACP reductase n=1 Tax=Paenalcaligenes hominis TaxID=643674 RepID=A0A1U9K1G7_9BURK|nr:SDR family oxidoreductase [Paenalcaligenes hominis]AQS51890.1 3-oxoacyl-ACP reductase [Paenalcaligenes hominis]
MNFKGQTVLVTGASRGLGAATAKAFAAQGALVVINYKQNTEAAQDTARACEQLGGQAWPIAADVQDASAVQAMVQDIISETGRIDVLVNNAFAPYCFNPDQRQRFHELSWEDCARQLDGSVKSTWLVSHAVVPHMQRACRGSIIHINSDLSEDPIVPYADYATAKAALNGLTKQMAADLGPYGIRVNSVAPGLIWPTDSSRATRASIREDIIARTPLRRIATPTDITGPIVFLASAQSAFMTGQCLVIDGGLVMR